MERKNIETWNSSNTVWFFALDEFFSLDQWEISERNESFRYHQTHISDLYFLLLSNDGHIIQQLDNQTKLQTIQNIMHELWLCITDIWKKYIATIDDWYFFVSKLSTLQPNDLKDDALKRILTRLLHNIEEYFFTFPLQYSENDAAYIKRVKELCEVRASIESNYQRLWLKNVVRHSNIPFVVRAFENNYINTFILLLQHIDWNTYKNAQWCYEQEISDRIFMKLDQVKNPHMLITQYTSVLWWIKNELLNIIDEKLFNALQQVIEAYDKYLKFYNKDSLSDDLRASFWKLDKKLHLLNKDIKSIKYINMLKEIEKVKTIKPHQTSDIQENTQTSDMQEHIQTLEIEENTQTTDIQENTQTTDIQENTQKSDIEENIQTSGKYSN